MDNSKKYLLSSYEFTCILIGTIVETSIVGLPSQLVPYAKQDAWISIIIASIYPLYIGIIGIYLSRKYPNENILSLSKKYFGEVVGSILNLLFLATFFSYLPDAIATSAIIFKTYIVSFMSTMKISIVILLISIYAISKGLKVLGRISSWNFCIFIIIILISLSVIPKGHFNNVTPIMQSSIKNILKASLYGAYYFNGMEILLLIYPYIKNKGQIKKSTIKAFLFVLFFYTFVVFMSIYYLGIDIIPKTVYPFFNVTEVIEVAVINNLRYIFIILWILISLSTISLIYYACTFILKDTLKTKKNIYLYIAIGIVALILIKFFYSERILKDKLGDITSLISIIYNVFYLALISIISCFKKDDKVEEC